jgi:aryl-alcohol dehydrogenase-like predicted oxidoreductase
MSEPSCSGGGSEANLPQLPKRRYKGDVELSVIGLGGVVLNGLPQEEADRIVSDSVARGVNYFEVAPTYGDAEERLGPALEPYRDGVFLACKTVQRDAEGVRDELARSLDRLRTDHVDLYQFHGVRSMEDVEQVLGPGGAGEAFLEARERGRARYLGLSAHAEEAAIALMDGFPCDSVLFPINYVCMANGGFGSRVLEHARRNGIARLAIKSLAFTRRVEGDDKAYPKCWYRPVSDPDTAERALRFTLSEDVTATIPPGDPGLYELCLRLATRFTPLSPDERTALLASAREVAPIFG